MRDLGPEELRRVQRGLVDHHGHALGLHALHRQVADAHDRLRLALADAIPHHLQHLVCHEVLAGAVGVHDDLDQVLRHVLVIDQQLLGVHSRRVPT